MRFFAVFPGFLALLALAFAPAATCALDLPSLDDPRPDHWALVRGPQLGLGTLRALDDLGSEVKARTAHELVVVCIDSTDGEDQRAFATRLFNRWGIGDRSRNDGLLLFVAVADRRVEIILGDGIDDDRQVATSQTIVDQEMRPRFRAGDRDGALLNGARACARRLLGLTAATSPPPGGEGPVTTVRIEADTTPQVADPPVELDLAHGQPALPVSTAHRPATYQQDAGQGPYPSAISWNLIGLAGGGGGSILGLLFWRRWQRNRPRICDHCQQPMVRLEEQQDDQYLDQGERTEERIGSVDYDVWCCSACQHVLKLRYGAFFTRYARCPGCQAVTKSSSETTLETATYDHGGLVRVDETCVACDYRNRYTRSTARKSRPATTGNRSSGIGGGFMGGSGGNSGSSGGGHSSGRGGGGGW